MKICSVTLDHKIEAVNVLVEITIGEYLKIANSILNKNEYQRRRVIKSTVSKQLKKDLETGCTIPSIILAVEEDIIPKNFDYKTSFDNPQLIEDSINKAFKKEELVIIDGLQRTNVMLDLQKDLQGKGDSLTQYLNHVLRAEIYVGIDKLGILYRMITLNSGQQTMSLRHLIEILYSNYKNIKIDGAINLYTQKQNIAIPETLNDFNFKDIIDGFNAYITQNEQPLDKVSVLDNIENIKKISNIRTKEKDVFTEFVIAYRTMLSKMVDVSEGWGFNEEELASEYKLTNKPFGATALSIFRKPQIIFGFGVALSSVLDFTDGKIEDIIKEIEKIELDKPETAFSLLLARLDEIRNSSKISIGAAQRVFFKFFFLALLMRNPYNPKVYLNFDNSVEEAVERTRRELGLKKKEEFAL
jgi:hypothetical protein